MKHMIIKKNLMRSVSLVIFSLSTLVFVSGCVTTNGDGATTEKVVTPATEKAEIYANLARGYIKKKQYAVAKGELEKALAIAPDHSKSNYIMGLLMIDIKEYDKVEQFMSKAVQLDPQNSAAAHDFGTFLCQTGKERRAVAYFDKAVGNPFFQRPELSLMRAGECLYKIGETERAESYLKKSLDTNPRLKPALFNLAKIKFDEGSYMSARAYIERFYAITKPQPESLFLGYQIESKLGANDVADDYRSTILENFPASEEAQGLR